VLEIPLSQVPDIGSNRLKMNSKLGLNPTFHILYKIYAMNTIPKTAGLKRERGASNFFSSKCMVHTHLFLSN
jgi:hypothetical protein